MSIGQVEQFEPDKGNFSSNIDRLNQYIAINDIKEEKKVALFVTIVGPATYEILKT